MKKIIDVCCGGKHFWYDKNNPLVEFCDKRYEEDIALCNGQHIHITPNTICDFKKLPFADESYYLVVFDPPHLVDKLESAWMVKKYGTLIFKWNETQIPTADIVKCFGTEPLFGHKSGKRMNTNWLVFFKEG